MSQTYAEQRAADERDYNFLINLMISKNKTLDELHTILIQNGRDETAAKRVIQRIRSEIADIKYEAAQKDMMYGALFFVGGLVVTAVTYSSASPGGRYLLAYGPIYIWSISICKRCEELKNG